MNGSGRFSFGVVTSAGAAASPVGGGAVVSVGVVEVVDVNGNVVGAVVVGPVVVGPVVELVPMAAAVEHAPSTSEQPAARAARRSRRPIRTREVGHEGDM